MFTEALISKLDAKVDTPETFKLSSSVCPSTSKLPFASILPLNVEIPETLRLSIETPPLKVDTPKTSSN